MSAERQIAKLDSHCESDPAFVAPGRLVSATKACAIAPLLDGLHSNLVSFFEAPLQHFQS
jgi:hypothetical protein